MIVTRYSSRKGGGLYASISGKYILYEDYLLAMEEAGKSVSTELSTSTKHDSFCLRKDSSNSPALGHTFHKDTLCMCGKSWEQQKFSPEICPLLLDRLQLLEDLDLAIAEAQEFARKPLKERIRFLDTSRQDLKLQVKSLKETLSLKKPKKKKKSELNKEKKT